MDFAELIIAMATQWCVCGYQRQVAHEDFHSTRPDLSKYAVIQLRHTLSFLRYRAVLAAPGSQTDR